MSFLHVSSEVADLKYKASCGDASAAFRLGCYYAVAENNNIAFKYYKIAFELDRSDDQIANRYIYYLINGMGCDKDLDTAFKLTTELYHKYHSMRITGQLAYLYMVGFGCEKDTKVANALYEKSATEGNSNSMYNLFLNHSYGRGVPKNARVASNWLYRAAELGYTKAQVKLAQELEKNNPIGALRYYNMALEEADLLKFDVNVRQCIKSIVTRDNVLSMLLNDAKWEIPDYYKMDITDMFIKPGEFSEKQLRILGVDYSNKSNSNKSVAGDVCGVDNDDTTAVKNTDNTANTTDNNSNEETASEKDNRVFEYGVQTALVEVDRSADPSYPGTILRNCSYRKCNKSFNWKLGRYVILHGDIICKTCSVECYEALLEYCRNGCK